MHFYRYLQRTFLAFTICICLFLAPVLPASAATPVVTPLSAVLYTGNGAELFTQPDVSTVFMTLPGDMPVQITGVTENGYFQILMEGQTYYIHGQAVSISTGTQAHKFTSIDAKAALVGDAVTGEIIYQANAAAKLAPASTTKILTTLLVLEAVERGQLSLDTPLVVTPTALAGIPYDASHVSPRLKSGEVMNVLQLLECVLIKSDCHACNVLAEAVAGSVDNFVILMNARAAQLGCVDTNFTNPSGYPDENLYTTAYSLFLITQEAMKYPTFQTIISLPTVTIAPTNLAPERILESTNALITPTEYYNPYVIGGKTGTALSSGSCLVTAARKGEKTIITVILGAATNTMSDGVVLKQQFSETNRLISMGLGN